MRVIGFVACGLAVHVLLSVLFVRYVASDHDALRMDARWLRGPVAVDVMVAGDSHPRQAVEAPVLGSAINVAVPGEHYLKTTFRVPWLLDHGTREVSTVLLPFDAVSFVSFKDDVFHPEVVWDRYVDWRLIGAHKGQRFQYAGKQAKAKLAPYVGEWQTLLQFFTSSRHFRAPGEVGPTLVRFDSGIEAARRHFSGADLWDADMVWAFRRLLDDLRGRGLRVVLVSYPVHRAYIAEARRLGVDPGRRAELLAEVLEPGRVDHLDFEAALVRAPELFVDGDHLNIPGKRRFSKLLAERLRAMGVLVSDRPR